MEKLTAEVLDDLCKRADKHKGKSYPVPAYITNAYGKRSRGKVLSIFIGYTKPRFASAEIQKNEKRRVVTFPIPNAILKDAKGVERKWALSTVVEYFESLESKV